LTELLDFVRPQKLNVKSVRLNEIMESSLQAFCAEFEKKNITIAKTFCSAIPLLDIDTDQFKRVLQNLFHNAMEAMPQGGVLNVTTELDPGWVKISIADTGVGISDDDIEKVFHPFFSSKSSGSGLGLAVCNQIISIHGGHIKLSRQIPYGVIFDIFLPVAGSDS
ncbi:MAG: ATP-binding protein, partial [Pseudomonadota bacterium]